MTWLWVVATNPQQGPAPLWLQEAFEKLGVYTRRVYQFVLVVAQGLLALITLTSCQHQSRPSFAGPEALVVRVLAEHPHDRSAFTQGLLWFRGKVVESTGLYARSGVRRWDLKTGTIELSGKLPDNMFGEGLALVGRDLVQLTWKNGKAIYWDLMTMRLLKEVPYEGEGWGLCYDGTRLVMSDGSDKLVFRSPKDFSILQQVKVRKQDIPVDDLNELECVGDEVYANVWQTDYIARIDAKTGVVTGWIDASNLLKGEDKRGTDVLNGIAYVPETKRFLLTGKNWPKMFEVEFVATQSPGGQR